MLALPACAGAQRPHEHAGEPHDGAGAAAVHEAMGGEGAHRGTGHHDGHAAAHLVLTPVRDPRPGDAERAARIVEALRRGIARYADHRAAVADGYEPFLPTVPQKVYHFTSTRRSIAEAFDFDPARPSSLLYEKTAAGYRLVGAMYHAPRRLSLDELDARVPLGVARWHRHVNLCVPRRGEARRWRESRDGAPRFGPAGSIATREACDAAGGRFIEHLFGWMVHVSPFEPDPAKVWGDE
jgi:hypothetical protein